MSKQSSKPGHPEISVIGADGTPVSSDEAHERFERALFESDTHIWEWDLERNDFYYNRSAPRWLGLDEIPLGKTNEEVVFGYLHPDDVDGLREEVRRSVVERKPLNYEYRLLDTCGEVVWVVARGNVIENDEGRVVMMSGTLANITEKKKVEAKLEEVIAKLASEKARAESATKSKSEFLATMSHEIRTPLNGVLGTIQLLLDTDLTPDQENLANIIHSSGDSLLDLIDDILDLSKIEAKKLELREYVFDLRSVLSEVVEMLQARIQEKQLTMLIDYPLAIPHRVLGDAGRVKQVLLNLLGNAIKFTDSGAIEICVDEIRREASQVELQISVNDTGIGISEADQKRLFESFTQADASPTREHGGTGLGLSISKNLVELMGGEIHVEANVGGGSSFRFNLPLHLDSQAIDPLLRKHYSDLNALLVLGDAREAGLVSKVFDECEIKTQRHETFSDVLTAISGFGKQPLLLLVDDSFEKAEIELLLNEAAKKECDVSLLLLTPAGQTIAHNFDGAVSACALRRPLSSLSIASILNSCINDNGNSNCPKSGAANLGRGSYIEGNPMVLVVEDNSVNQKVAAAMLENIGCRVDIVANGEEAIEKWTSTPYDLILMDCQMPVMDGYDATRSIRNLETAAGKSPIPIIAMTANAMEEDRQACLEAGMDDYTSKPVSQEALFSLVDKWKDHAADNPGN